MHIMNPEENNEEIRLVAIQGAIAAAVGIISRRTAQPLLQEREQRLAMLGERLSKALRLLENNVLEALTAVPAPSLPVEPASGIDEAQLISTIEKWQMRYRVGQEENEKMQRMLVTLKTRYEELQDENTALLALLEEEQKSRIRAQEVAQLVAGRLDGLLEMVGA